MHLITRFLPVFEGSVCVLLLGLLMCGTNVGNNEVNMLLLDAQCWRNFSNVVETSFKYANVLCALLDKHHNTDVKCFILLYFCMFFWICFS